MRTSKFGAHLSSGKGKLSQTAERAMYLGAGAMQIMLGTGISWEPYALEEGEAEDFRATAAGLDVYVHLPYTINPCMQPDQHHFCYQKKVIRNYLRVCEALGVKAAVIHPGYSIDMTAEDAERNFVLFMEEMVQHMPTVKMLFETDSGSKQGTKVGSPEFIAKVLNLLPYDKFGMCIDTEHLYARGLDLWDDKVRTQFIAKYSPLIELVHLNAPDPGVVLGGFLDRHSVPLESYANGSKEMILDFVTRFNSVVERSKADITEQDINYVLNLLSSKRKHDLAHSQVGG